MKDGRKGRNEGRGKRDETMKDGRKERKEGEKGMKK